MRTVIFQKAATVEATVPPGQGPALAPEPIAQAPPPIQDPDEERKAKDRERKRQARQAAKEAGQGPAQAPPKERKRASLADELKDLDKNYKDAPPAPGAAAAAQASDMQVADFVTGHVVLAVLDSVFPALLVMLHRKGRPGLTADQLRLTPAQRTGIMPLADAAAQRLLGWMDPVALFLACSFAMYSSNLPPAPKDPPPAKGAPNKTFG